MPHVGITAVIGGGSLCLCSADYRVWDGFVRRWVAEHWFLHELRSAGIADGLRRSSQGPKARSGLLRQGSLGAAAPLIQTVQDHLPLVQVTQ